MTALCYVNGTIGPVGESGVPVTDLALQRGYGVFDYARTHDGRLFHFADHLARLRRSAAELRLEVPLSDGELRELAERLIAGSDLRRPAIRMILTGGPATDSPQLARPNFVVIAEEAVDPPAGLFETGADVITYEFLRDLPHVKSINYLNAIRIEPLLRDRNAYDVIYHSDPEGVTECPRSNVFLVHGDTLVTPSDHVLHGITRSIVLRLAASRLRVEQRPVSLAELRAADEVFLTSTSKRLLPVRRLDDTPIGPGPPGIHTCVLSNLLAEYIRTSVD